MWKVFVVLFFLSLYLTIKRGIFFYGPFLSPEDPVASWSLSDIRRVSFNPSHFKFCSHIFPSPKFSLDR